ncbi:P2X purinoceptor 7-like [Anneissia japonica]|uniref:P2X purinoceptor 7-like n=1 Tax=Anneissia japonica TaxID=1529436 RepID=UPI00142551E2|nr:P2X purinoceptor 7-like [Anneissia japonica]
MAENFNIRREREKQRRNAYAFEPVLQQDPQQQQFQRQPSSSSRPRLSRLNNTDWCRCGNCRPMPKEKECLCCHEGEDFSEKMTDVDCILKNESFKKVCLDKEILEVVFASRKELLGEGINHDELNNRNYRHIGYRCFIWWVYNRLKKRDRRVIPSCCVWAIRDQFPSVDGDYTGFIDAVADNEMDFVFE